VTKVGVTKPEGRSPKSEQRRSQNQIAEKPKGKNMEAQRLKLKHSLARKSKPFCVRFKEDEANNTVIDPFSGLGLGISFGFRRSDFGTFSGWPFGTGLKLMTEKA
jgi:hypothetical protein